jgi:hypothetical protein
VIWPAAALAVLLLGFVVVYGSALQARLDARSARSPEEPASDTEAVV